MRPIAPDLGVLGGEGKRSWGLAVSGSGAGDRLGVYDRFMGMENAAPDCFVACFRPPGPAGGAEPAKLEEAADMPAPRRRTVPIRASCR